MTITVDEFAKKCKVSRTIIMRRIKKGVITAELGLHNGKPCYLIDTELNKVVRAGKPGRPFKEVDAGV